MVRGIPDFLSCIPDSKGQDFRFQKQKFAEFRIPQAKIARIRESGFPYMWPAKKNWSVNVPRTVSHSTSQYVTDQAVLCATSQWSIFVIFILLRFLLVMQDGRYGTCMPGPHGLFGDSYSSNSRIN